MERSFPLRINPAASAELGRQFAFSDSPGIMHLDLVEDIGGEEWFHIRIRPGKYGGIPIVRIDGVTLYASSDQISLFKGLRLNFYGDLSGGGFLISVPDGSEACACGAGFRALPE